MQDPGADAPLALVTGGSGFVGRRMIEMLLERGYRVRNFDLAQTWEHPHVEMFQGNLTKQQDVSRACEGVSVVFHVASIISLSDRIPYDKIFAVNVEGTRYLIEGCQEHGVAKLVYTSSASVLFVGEDLENVTEDAPFPTDFPFAYAETKALAEQEVLAANGSDNGLPEGLLTAAIRPHSIYGPRDAISWPNVIDKALGGKLKFVLGSGDNLSDYTYVDNCVHGHLLAAERLQHANHAPAGEAYHIHDGNPVPMWGMLRDIAVGMGVDPAKVGKLHIPASVAYGLGWMNETSYWLASLCCKLKGDGPVMTRFTVLAATTHHYYSIAKAQRDLGYDPIVPQDEAMRITLEYFRELYADRL